MSITTYDELKTAIANWLNRSDLTSYIPDFITMNEADMNRRFHTMYPPLKALEQNTTGNTAATIALPAGYVGTKTFKITANGAERDLTYITPQQMARLTGSGYPNYYTVIGANLVLGHSPSPVEPYSWDYYKKLDALSGSVSSNWALANAPDAYLFGSLRFAEPFLKNDGRITTWGTLFENAMDGIEKENVRILQSGSTLQMRSDAAV